MGIGIKELGHDGFMDLFKYRSCKTNKVLAYGVKRKPFHCHFLVKDLRIILIHNKK